MTDLEIKTTEDFIRDLDNSEYDFDTYIEKFNKKWVSLESIIDSYNKTYKFLMDLVISMEDNKEKEQVRGRIFMIESLVEELEDANKE